MQPTTMLSPKMRQARRACAKSMVFGESSRSSRPCSPLDQEKVLKTGWLKRQRIILKNWQLRWFVLKAEALYYYKDQDETKEQGFIPLMGSRVSELAINQEEPGRHLFEIVAEGDRNHESFLLMANSESDVEEWVRVIYKAIWALHGGGIFGQHIEETMLNEGQFGTQQMVPALVERCTSFIREHGLRKEGLFRSPGHNVHIRELQDAFYRGENLLFDSAADVHTVASLLMLYLGELPEPVIPFTKYAQFLSCAMLITKDREMGIIELGKHVNFLPKVNFNLLEHICRFLYEVLSHSDANNMSIQNLATVFGASLLRPRVEDPVTLTEGNPQLQHLMTVLIIEHARLYGLDNPETTMENPSLCKNNSLSKGKVEWLKQEITVPPQESLQVSNSSKDDILTPSVTTLHKDEAVLVKRKTEENVNGQTSDNKEEEDSLTQQSNILSAGKCSFKGSSDGSRGNIGGSAGDVSATGDRNWLMNGMSSLQAHRRTTSSGAKLKYSPRSLTTLSLKETKISQREHNRDIPWTPPAQRILHPSHRLSAYDNVPSSTLSLPAESSSIWTVFDISLTEAQNQKVSQSDGLNALNHETSQALDDGLTKLVTELQHELQAQRVGFEYSICKLEEKCSKHRARINQLEKELDQERKRYHMLEIRFRNSERGRQDAENRNILLRKEMEDFFASLECLATKPS
ncbi:rho GTPase-activating protein 22 [Stigmatopora nigra]